MQLIVSRKYAEFAVSPTSSSNVDQPAQCERNDAGHAIPIVVDSAALMGGRRELIIQHGTGSYRLRITASNKLILTK
jgi:hemin uptake protein HemP